MSEADLARARELARIIRRFRTGDPGARLRFQSEVQRLKQEFVAATVEGYPRLDPNEPIFKDFDAPDLPVTSGRPKRAFHTQQHDVAFKFRGKYKRRVVTQSGFVALRGGPLFPNERIPAPGQPGYLITFDILDRHRHVRPFTRDLAVPKDTGIRRPLVNLQGHSGEHLDDDPLGAFFHELVYWDMIDKDGHAIQQGETIQVALEKDF
jgi:hypothetical protein